MTLAPCPFCGGTRVRFEEVTYAHDDGEDDNTIVECYNSGGLSPDLVRRVGKALGREG